MTIKEEILVYHNVPFKKYRWISYISFAQVGFLLVNLFTIPTAKAVKYRQELIESRNKRREEKDLEVIEAKDSSLLDDTSSVMPEEPISKKVTASPIVIFSVDNLSANASSRPYICAAIGGVTIAVLAGAFYYARRMVHMITLLPNKRVRISVFSPLPFTKPPTFELSLVDVSCKSSRHSQNNYSILKLRNFSGYHLVHKKEGEFLKPELYDAYLSYERSWAK